MERGAFNQTALTGDEYADWVAKEEQRHRELMKEAGFIGQVGLRGRRARCEAATRAPPPAARPAQDRGLQHARHERPMNDKNDRPAASTRTLELVVAALLFVLRRRRRRRQRPARRALGRRRSPGWLLPVLHRAPDLSSGGGRVRARARRPGEGREAVRDARRAQAGHVDAGAVDHLRGADQVRSASTSPRRSSSRSSCAGSGAIPGRGRSRSRSASARCFSCCSRSGSSSPCRRGRSNPGSGSTDRVRALN